MRLCSWMWGVILAAPLAVGCASPRSGTWLEDLRSREAIAGPLQRVGSSDGSFASEVGAAMTGSVEAGAQADYLALDIGGDTPIECALYHDEVESASTLQTLAAGVFEDLEERLGAKVEPQITVVDAGVIGASPFLQLSWGYRSVGDGGEVVGELKQMIASREGRSVYCVHHENGFNRSFERVFRELVGNIRFSSYDDLRPYFTQVDVLSTGGERFGYVSTTVTLDDDGEPRVVNYTAEIDRAADGSITARDLTAVEHSDVQGVLRGEVWTEVRNGDVSSNLVLENRQGAGWDVSGTLAGAAVQSAFVETKLSSWLGDVGVLRRLVAASDGAATTASSPVWQPEIDVANAIERKFRKLEPVPGGDAAVSIETGAVRSLAVVDDKGRLLNETRGDDKVLRQRIFIEGALR